MAVDRGDGEDTLAVAEAGTLAGAPLNVEELVRVRVSVRVG